nr:MAG TPA_asm: MTAbl13 of grafted MCoTI-II, trypsin inhibitor, Hydrolase Inhibitor [Bacteriophage sp.]
MVNRREHDCDNACVPHSNRVYGFKSCRGNQVTLTAIFQNRKIH